MVDNFTGEVDALGNQIGEAVAQAHTTITNMGRLAAKEWEQFLQANPVGQVIDFAGQRLEGLGKAAWGLGETAWHYNQIRALLDPVGYGRDVGGMALGMAPLVGLGDDHAPGVLESWKEVLKDNVHWDDWARSPGEAYGKMEADVATNFFPEGPAAKLDRAREIADRLKAFRERLFGTRDPGDSKPPRAPASTGSKTEPPDQPHPPTDQEPQSGSPTPGPQSKPGAGDNPLPKSPTESKTPVENKPATGEAVKPTGAQPDSVGTPGGSVSAASGEKPPLIHSEHGGSVPAQAPAASSGESRSAAQLAAGSKPLAASTPTSESPGHSTLAGHQLSHGGTQSGGVGDAHPNEPSPPQGGGHRDEGGGAPHEPSPPVTIASAATTVSIVVKTISRPPQGKFFLRRKLTET
ncbi:hypothetical protein [Mycobacterium gastri]|uniref:hypothetical protein n=1 Tax=Mycobacterium gastri TaxID=1777 RepID=UPI0031345EEA